MADDLIEPLRPWVDKIAYELYQSDQHITINREIKIPFLNLISNNVLFGDKHMPLMVASHYLMSDLKRNLTKELSKLTYPTLQE